MPKYHVGGTTVRRKNLYMPCVIGPKFETADEDEQARILKATYWADNVSNSEWPALLAQKDCSPSARSRLKKKSAGWLMALARMYLLNPELFAEVAEKAALMYEDQIEDWSMLLRTIRNLADQQVEAEKQGVALHSAVWLGNGNDEDE